MNAADRGLGKGQISREETKTICPVEVADCSRLQAEPKSAARTVLKATNAFAVPSRTIWDGEMGKINAVKASEAVLCAHPQKSIRGLRDGTDSVEWQATLAVPSADIVFKKAAGGVEGKENRGGKEES